MDRSFVMLVVIACFALLMLALPLALIGMVVRDSFRRAAVGRWDQTPEGRLRREALESFLVCKARLEGVVRAPEPPVVRLAYVERSVPGYRRMRMVFEREERSAVRMHVRLLPLGGCEVLTEANLTLPAQELHELVPGKIFSALYDPREPRRFYVNTLRRDANFVDAATLRTRVAEETYRASLAFSPGPGQDYRR